MVDLSTPVVSPTTCSKPLAVSQHSHKIVVPSALGRLVSKSKNNSFSSVNPLLWGLYCIRVQSLFDCCKLVCYHYIDKFVFVFVSRKEDQTISWPFYFNISILISRLVINWTEWSTIQGVIARVISKLDEHEARGQFEITSTITPSIVRHKVKLLINCIYNKFRN